MKRNKIIMIGGVLGLFFIVVGITYAYFSANIFNNENTSTINYEAGSLAIELDGGNSIVANAIIPGDSPWATKTFTVIGDNDSNGYMPYSVSLVVDENTYSDDAISYTLEGSNTSNNGSIIENRENTEVNYTDIIGSGYFTPGKNLKHTYTLKLYFLETNTDQSEDMRSTFKAHIEINGGRASKNKIRVTFDADGGEVDTLSKEVVINGAYGELPIPTKEGYEFLGWAGDNLFIVPTTNQSVGHISSSVNFSLNNGKYLINGTVPIYSLGQKASDLYDLTNAANYPFYLNKDNSILLKAGTYTYSAWKTSGYCPNNLFFIGIMDKNTRDLNYATVHFSKSLPYETFTLQSDTEVFLYASFFTRETYTIDNLSFYVKLQKSDEYEPYFIDKYTKVVQYEDHTLKAIWKEL